MKTQKEKLRKEILCGIPILNEEYSPIQNETERFCKCISEVKMGTIDMTTQEYMIFKFSLNIDQKRAFLIITDHLENKSFMKKGMIYPLFMIMLSRVSKKPFFIKNIHVL